MSKKKTTKEFIQGAKEIYGDLFSFDEETKYLNNKTKVTVICKFHGRVKVQPDNFLHKHSGCPICSRVKKKAFEEFEEQANFIHNNKYHYDKESYINTQTKTKIICPIHGEFWQTPNNHLNGRGCSKCNGMNISSNERIKCAKTLYNGFYDYSKSDFNRVKENTTVICPIHGEFITTYDRHVNQHQGCPKCGGTRKLTQEEFIEKLKETFGDKYDYSKTEYINMRTKVTLICPIHGDFVKMPMELLYNKCGCPQCIKDNKISVLEEEIKNCLDKHNIKYEQYKSFEWLGKLSYDFYLPDYNAAIECQGKQHFGQGGWSKDYNFQEQFERDERKHKLSLENGVNLLYFSNVRPKNEYLGKVFIDKNDLLKSL